MTEENVLDEGLVAKEIAQKAAQQAADQTAQQIGEAVSQAIAKVMQTQTLTTGVSATESRQEDIGGGERYTLESADNAGFNYMNKKRTVEEYQDISLERKQQAMKHLANVDNIAQQALQNAVETANLVGKKAIENNSLAIDRQWNVNATDLAEVEGTKVISTSLETLRTLVADVLSQGTGKAEK